jgi:benzodiazapine receptor
MLALLVFLALSLAAAVVGGLSAAGGTDDWYSSIERPSWTPPDWLFGPVWIVLYAAIGVAAWLVWRRRSDVDVTPALTAWGVQLALNAAWTGLFFGLKRPGIAFFEIVLLVVAVAVTTILFARVTGPAGALLVPYLAWVSFAAALNGAIWWLNR